MESKKSNIDSLIDFDDGISLRLESLDIKLPKFKLNIFDMFKHIKKSNLKYWSNLEEDVKKDFNPIPLIRWLSSNTAEEILYLNYFVNPYITKLKIKPRHEEEHKGLFYNLMTLCTKDDGKNYSYPKKYNIKFPKCTKILAEYLEYSIREAKEVLQFYTNEDMIEICNEMGFQKDVLADLKKELKKRNV